MSRRVGRAHTRSGRTRDYGDRGRPGALDPPEVVLVRAMLDLARNELGMSAAVLVRGVAHPNPDRTGVLAWLDEPPPTPAAVATIPHLYDPGHGEWLGSFRWWCKVAGLDEGGIARQRTLMRAIRPRMRPVRRARVRGWADVGGD